MKPRNGVQIVLVIAVLVWAATLSSSCGTPAEHGVRYHCPMHPTYIVDQPGDCPICGMRLVPIEEKTAPTAVAAYICPMDPDVRSDQPGRCPKCGMKLVEAGKREGGGEGAHDAAGASPHDAEVPGHVPGAPDHTSGTPGQSSIEISAEGIKLAGVQTATATRGLIQRSMRTVGTVVADETRIRHIHTKIPGWVEKLHVNFTGQFVTKGEPLLSIYSQELVATQEEYLRARETASRFNASELPVVRKGGEDLAKAARRRLELFDVPDAFIRELERSGKVQRTVTLDAPVSGFVTMKGVFEGHQVEPAAELFTVTDLSSVWVEADFYEYEAGALRLGERASVDLPYDPATRLEGRIAFIYPTLDPATRTLKVRFTFPNPGTVLKPGMFATVELDASVSEGIVIPDSALLDTGERQVVFVSKGEGAFEPRAVTAGVRAGGNVQVLAGLAEGEQVVVKANFLLDSESRLRAAVAGMGGDSHQHGSGQ